jgi:hypothetical protein
MFVFSIPVSIDSDSTGPPVVLVPTDATTGELDLEPLEVRGDLQGRVGTLLRLTLTHLDVRFRKGSCLAAKAGFAQKT